MNGEKRPWNLLMSTAHESSRHTCFLHRATARLQGVHCTGPAVLSCGPVWGREAQLRKREEITAPCWNAFGGGGTGTPSIARKSRESRERWRPARRPACAPPGRAGSCARSAPLRSARGRGAGAAPGRAAASAPSAPSPGRGRPLPGTAGRCEPGPAGNHRGRARHPPPVPTDGCSHFTGQRGRNPSAPECAGMPQPLLRITWNQKAAPSTPLPKRMKRGKRRRSWGSEMHFVWRQVGRSKGG